MFEIVFSNWRNSNINDQNLNEIMIWPELILSRSLLQFAKSDQAGIHWYLTNEGVALLLSLTQSTQEDIQEMVVATLSTSAIADYEYVVINVALA